MPNIMLKSVFLIALLVSHTHGHDTCSAIEPPLPAMMPGKDKPKLILAQDVDFAPYAYLSDDATTGFSLTGFGYDFAKAMGEMCDLEVHVVQTAWDKCWSGTIGPGMTDGSFHGCMTYTHTYGARNRYLEFSHPILDQNKPAGILTRLGKDGKPVLSPTSNLSGKKIVDVKGWAPTVDGLSFVKNSCTGKPFSGFETIVPDVSGNDAALEYLLNGTADGMFVYADQAHNYPCDVSSVVPTWNCTMWSKFGKDFAYIHTGMFNHAANGTTLTMSRMGSGIPSIVNPCIKKFLNTKKYFQLCKKYDLLSSCFANAYFPAKKQSPKPWELPTWEHNMSCADGYCKCDGS